MSYWLEDQNGYLGDFCSGGGAIEMLDDHADKKSLQQFLAQGRADEALQKEVIAEVTDLPPLNYIARLLAEAEGEVIITDGTLDVDDDEEDEVLLNRDGEEPGTGNREPETDPTFMRLVKAMASDLRPVRDVLEQIISADDAQIAKLMSEMESAVPDIAREVFAAKGSEEVLRDLAAVEFFRGATEGT